MEPNTSSETPMEQTHTESTNQAAEAAQASVDVSEYRTFAILGYIIPFLFFLPLLDEKTKHVAYVRFHANQQLILLVLGFVVYVLHGILFGIFMMLGYYVIQLLNLALLALAIVGIYNAYHDQMKALPFVGQFQILK